MSCELRDLVDLVPFAAPALAGPNLYEKLAAAMVEIRSPSKDGEMRMSDNGKPIAYVKNDDLMESIRKPLAKQGVAFLVDLTEIKRGDKGGIIGVWVEMTFTDGRERHVARWYGEGRSVPIACTFAVKYYLMKVLLVGAGEADDEGADDGAAARAIRAEGERHPAATRIQAQSRGRKEAPAAKPAPPAAKAAPESKASKTDLAMRAQAPLEPPPPSPLLDELRELMAQVDAVKVNATDEDGKLTVIVDREASYQRVKDRLRAWAEEEPGIVATDEKGEPAPRLCNDDQLARLVGRYRDLAEPPGETEGYDL